ncbi:threonyl-tRNA synthetase [Borealophlyctis nickersoniae]|nr:threonyl-tRNA synthetase [Borealophlyctis nickersoniae]
MADQAAAEVAGKVAEVTDKVKNMSVKKDKKPKGGDAASALELSPPPSYIQHRIDMFDRLKKQYDAEVAVKRFAAKPRETIKITLPDGKVIEGTSWETTPMDIAKGISKSLSEKIVIAKVDGNLFDLVRPLEQSCSLRFLTFDDDEGKKVYWHSSAHVLGEACELHYGCHLCIGPPIEEGFYYEMGMDRRHVTKKDGRAVAETDWASLEQLAKKAISEKQPFERLVVSKTDLLEMFKDNKYKVHIINDKIPDGTSTTVYRCGPLIDLCYGPHIPNTGKIKAFAVTKTGAKQRVQNSASYFLGDAKNDSLQRVYGISFPDAKQMKEYKQFLEEAAKRDHRKIGQEQELFFFHELSPGSCFFLPHGARIYNTLIDLQKSEYRKRGFHEVVTPNMFNVKLWETSGHWQNYQAWIRNIDVVQQEDMFSLDVEKEKFALKPMNCPSHCLMFKHRERSYRELPLRLADFGVLHRNEASGALTGLTRLGTEMDGCLDFLQHIYGIFGFTFSLKLSTRPEKFLGEIEQWNKAEALLEEALKKFGHPWELNPGDGAFYGPKIDIVISDALRRRHQCATIQLDFQLPERFQLSYRTGEASASKPEESKAAATSAAFQRPVMIHRAILGSVERMIAILTENFAGKWPFWLSPRQVMIVPVGVTNFGYAEQVREKLQHAGLYAEADLSDSTLNKKVRNAEIAHWNFIFVVGNQEEESGSVNCRNRDDPNSKNRGEVYPLEVILGKLVSLKESKSLRQEI